MRRTGHVVSMGQTGNEYKCWSEHLKRPLGKPRRDGRIILKLFLKKPNLRLWTGFIWIRIGVICRLLRR
jgi:hypothetical protein